MAKPLKGQASFFDLMQAPTATAAPVSSASSATNNTPVGELYLNGHALDVLAHWGIATVGQIKARLDADRRIPGLSDEEMKMVRQMVLGERYKING